MPDALQMLKEDHRKVQDIFKQFERAEDTSEKKRLVDEALMELEIHAQLEEEIFYPAVEQEVKPEDDLMEEAEEEHHVAKLLMAELKRMRPQNKNYDAKFTVLAENVKHHIQEEETEMLPKAAELGSERMQELGEEMAERKLELMRSPRRNGTTRSSNGRRTTTTRRRTTTRSRASTGTTRRTSKTGTARKRSTTSRSRSTGTRTRTATRGTRRSAATSRKRSATTRRKTTATRARSR
jgi:hemerythrin-like domain-containing protein